MDRDLRARCFHRRRRRPDIWSGVPPLMFLPSRPEVAIHLHWLSVWLCPGFALAYGVVLSMTAHAVTFTVSTHGKGTYEITDDVARVVRESGVSTGTATVFLRHTSASLVIYENADPSARTDLHAFFERLAPEGEDYYVHTAEGDDDTTSHFRAVLTRSSEVIPVVQGRLALGTWQGIFVFEHRRAAHQRSVVVTIIGV